MFALLVLQWADECIERRRHMVKRLDSGTHARMQAVAENLMPPSVVQELRATRFGSNTSRLGCVFMETVVVFLGVSLPSISVD